MGLKVCGMTDMEFAEQLRHAIAEVNTLLYQAVDRDLDVFIEGVKNQIIGNRVERVFLIVKVSKEL